MICAFIAIDQEWIKYTVDFIFSCLAINLNFKYINLKNIDQSQLTGFDIVIYYGKEENSINSHIWIPENRDKCLIKSIKNKYYYRNKSKSIFKADIINYIFERISYKFEYNQEASGKPIKSLAVNLIDYPYNIKEPEVNIIIHSLEKCICNILTDNKNIPLKTRYLYPDNKQFAICLTHDIDTIQLTLKTVLKQIRHSFYRSKQFIIKNNFKKLMQEYSSLFKKNLQRNLYNFNKISEIEKSYNVNSTYNIYVKIKTNKINLIEWIYNPEYNINKHKKLFYILNNLYKKGSEIAIHGSYYSFNNISKLEEEIQLLEKIFNIKVTGIRQHFLQYSQENTALIHQELGLKYDMSLGFRDINGFRGGSCTPHYLFDHKDNKKINILEIPLAIMDGVLFDREFATYEEAWNDVIGILNTIKEMNGCCSILWHNHVFNEDLFPGWAKVYKDILQWIKDNNGWMGSCAELLNWYEHTS